jgi:hypothetical protein
MNIIYVGDCGPKPSGAPISCDQLTRAFARRGWRVRVLAPALSAGDPDLAAFNAARPEIEAHYYPVPRYFFHPFERPPADWEDATSAGVIQRFRFQPFVDNAVMPRYMNLADLVVMPSEREGLSRVYLEAQACAKTLLASDIPGAREAVTHGETGRLFRRGDIDDLTEKTLLAAGDPALRARIGRQARQYVERHHDIDRAVDQYMALLQLQCER